jgi:hypothetical protein
MGCMYIYVCIRCVHSLALLAPCHLHYCILHIMLLADCHRGLAPARMMSAIILPLQFKQNRCYVKIIGCSCLLPAMAAACMESSIGPQLLWKNWPTRLKLSLFVVAMNGQLGFEGHCRRHGGGAVLRDARWKHYVSSVRKQWQLTSRQMKTQRSSSCLVFTTYTRHALTSGCSRHDHTALAQSAALWSIMIMQHESEDVGEATDRISFMWASGMPCTSDCGSDVCCGAHRRAAVFHETCRFTTTAMKRMV